MSATQQGGSTTRFSPSLAGTGATAVVLVLLIGSLSGLAVFGPGEPRSGEAAFLDEVNKLLAADAQAKDVFGWSVAVSGDTTVQSGPDGDGDGVPDASDNCPNTANAGQANADGDQWGDTCDNCPTTATDWFVNPGDTDCDGFADTITYTQRASEAFVGTDPNDSCADTATPNDERGPAFGEPLSPWVTDTNDDGITTLSDVLAVSPYFLSPSPNPNYWARFDWNGDGKVGLSDVLAVAPFFLKTCVGDPPTVTAGGYRMSDPIPNVDFDEMIGMAVVPGQPDVAIVITQAGLLYRISISGAFTPEPFGDISAMVTRGGDEGLLSIVFRPGDADHVYLNYTTGTEYYQPVVAPPSTPSPTIPPDPKRNVISLFDIVDDELDLASERIIIEVLEPGFWHNVNEMVFGPDGMMYVGAGDGGSLNAEYDADHGQGVGNLLATIFRIDPLPGGGYDIPQDNPFFGVPGAAEEVWAYGLRNPWRLSFDSETGDLWTGDVGEFFWEEVDKVIKGKNYGWEIIEGEYNNPDGFFCHGLNFNCTPPPNYEDPRATYCHSFVTNCEFKSPDAVDIAIIGGYVYRGSQMPELDGWYIYADHGSARIRAFDTSDDSSEPIILAGSAGAPCLFCVRSFVQLADGELLVLTAPHDGPGAIYRFQRVP